MEKTFFTLAATTLMIFAACSSNNAQDKLITPDGVAGLKIGAEKPDFPAPYTIDFWEDDYNGIRAYNVTDGSGELVLTYFIPYQIEVYSPEYKTADGIAAGGNLQEAIAEMKKSGKEPKIIYYRDSADFYLDCGNGIHLVAASNSLKGGQERYNDWYLKSGDSNDLKLSDFADDAQIKAIRVRKD